MLKVTNISKKYKNIDALNSVTFEIPDNSIFGILGANGSGKSTFMKILAGLIYDWSGNICYKGLNINQKSMLLKRDFGYLIEAPTFYEYLSAKQNLQLLSRISNIENHRIDYVLDLVDLKNRSKDKVDTYSYGMKQRLGIAQALLHDPKVIVLDEPNNGLDPNGIADMTRLIKQMESEGKTICLSTHNLKDVEEVCTDFTIFKNGRNTIASSMEKQLENSRRWLVSVKSPSSAISILDGNGLFKVVNKYHDSIIIESNSKNTVRDLNNLLNELDIYKISKQSNLIEYFRND